MTAQRKEVAHDVVVRARNDYLAKKPVRQICAETGLSTGLLYAVLAGERGPDPLTPIARRRVVVGTKARELPGRRAALVTRLWTTADRQVREIEKRLRRGEQQPGERERDARMLAALVRTLRDLNAFDEATKAAGAAMDANENDDMPTDIDAFRNELARRIHAFVDQRTGARVPAGADDVGGDGRE